MHKALRLTAMAGLFMASIAQAATTIDVYRDPNCGCCKSWIKYLEANGFSVNDHVEPNMSAVKQRVGVAPRLSSCHTAVIGGKFVEGHVPVAQIHELEKRPELLGIAAPGMPVGSPGMEMGQTKQAYQIIGLTRDGTDEVVANYPAAQ
ncbi:DUF411 domain-containing protein [Pseudomonas nitroreducens]|uniref:DUF411 domain-containing protein n=1 Tax=Pseudomonas nitroreducens TaxID=46680 RepID=A0ABS0KFZ4_PSENT|nr:MULTISPECIES: DUF411 domain-containing protein [Pseudomonas]MBG6286295.1 DUF411 domain-containing protein [Pseudomonas nitroreducens]MDG9857947.1 DUF411 domain-containing protein [Pseudomonas nitroreducens]MDH1077016.1 DUF411 domain-containing protein [Pseudomonas nitroreducens]NNN25464.1 DUF411 domain-containing protein [Pseudomonas nitroreducens]UCL90204.1 DUF411 domain-containing protein [Pseudomonas sp. HS-18]